MLELIFAILIVFGVISIFAALFAFPTTIAIWLATRLFNEYAFSIVFNDLFRYIWIFWVFVLIICLMFIDIEE